MNHIPYKNRIKKEFPHKNFKKNWIGCVILNLVFSTEISLLFLKCVSISFAEGVIGPMLAHGRLVFNWPIGH